MEVEKSDVDKKKKRFCHSFPPNYPITFPLLSYKRKKERKRRKRRNSMERVKGKRKKEREGK
jgi:hypothetical protein